MQDFPAAHSMDTTWFAVDRDGHVAVLDTLEAGALPNDLAQQADEYAVLDALAPLPEVRVLLDDAGHRADVRGNRGRTAPDHTVRDPYTANFVIVFLAAGARIDDLEALSHVRRVPATTGEALVIARDDQTLLDELHARGACRWCRDTWYLDRDHGVARGLYLYRHITDNWIAGPYARLSVPETARTLDELPAIVRETALRFDGRFAELPVLQPVEHWACRAHGETWLASDFETRRSFETGEIVDDDED